MSRKKRVYKKRGRGQVVDTIYHDSRVLQLINRIMIDGKKSIAEKICYSSFRQIKEVTGLSPFDVFIQAIENIKPSLELRSVKIAKSTFQVPFPIHEKRKLFFATKWLVESADEKKTNEMYTSLAFEIMDAYQNKGKCVDKKQRLHKMAEANRAYLRFRW
uniref:Ribosomal protein S7 n=1 Tax=Jakoba libera TaxID=143017 RepID=M4QA38_JAKLI|nr:ribosomal protein S7 [Jakoba libera]AGH24221.1 ribosomal protein S7 [Jakoba libera]